MVFSSYLFLFYFLPITLVAYYGLPASWRLALLTILSYVFYGWTNPLYVPLMWLSTAIDYVAGRVIADEAKRQHLSLSEPQRTRLQKLAVWFSVVSNLSLLGYFKYSRFAVETYQSAVRSWGLSSGESDIVWQVALPLGISFYTFQSLSYTLDVYRGHVRPARSFLEFACFVSLFPQLVAGPIIRYESLADQLQQRQHSWSHFSWGVLLFELGLSKKVLLANPCGYVANQAFQAGGMECGQAWWGLWAYTLQIYFDFSGYSDMAMGLGAMFGFTFPRNFNAPYLSTSLTDFWRRWHISLSSFLREYLYIPLGGNRHGRMRSCINLMFVMLLGGLWHGAAWHFVAWGAYHGFLLCCERIAPWNATGDNSKSLQPGLFPTIRRAIPVARTILLVAFGWVLFRADNMVHAQRIYQELLGLAPAPPGAVLLWTTMFQPYHVLCVICGTGVVLVCPTTEHFVQRPNIIKVIWALAMFLLSIVFLATQQYNPFIYFLF